MEQGLVLSGFYYGYICTQILGGFLADKYGAKWIVGGSILIAGSLGLLIPTLARFNERKLFNVVIIHFLIMVLL